MKNKEINIAFKKETASKQTGLVKFYRFVI